MIRIIVVEDNAIVRRGIISLLDEQEDLQVVGAAENGFIAIELLEKGLQSDILLTDFNMPGMDGSILSEKVHVLFPKLKTIIVSRIPRKQALLLKRIHCLAHQFFLEKNQHIQTMVLSP